MSRPRLHSDLLELYSSKNAETLIQVLLHPDFQSKMNEFALTFEVKEFTQAFIHTSFAHEFQVSHQEQLEFLGDSVLQLMLTEELYRRFPTEKEGKLSKLRSALVNEKSLSLMARALGLSDLILVGRGEFNKKLFLEEAVLADTFEAMLAQIYRFMGLEFTRSLYLSWLNQFIPNAFDKKFMDDFDAKSKLQEAVLARYKKLPSYTSVQKGNEFEVSLWINDELKAQGVYQSKKAGEKDLAQSVLKKGNF